MKSVVEKLNCNDLDILADVVRDSAVVSAGFVLPVVVMLIA